MNAEPYPNAIPAEDLLRMLANDRAEREPKPPIDRSRSAPPTRTTGRRK